MLRRKLLMKVAGISVGAAGLATAARAAGAPLAKEAVGYQDIPRNREVCAQCVFFVAPAAAPDATGARCRMVAGPISPNGWCEIWAPVATHLSSNGATG